MADSSGAGISGNTSTMDIDDTDSKPWTSQITDEIVTADQKYAKMPVERNAYAYNMDHPERGRAIIFNNKNFTSPSLNKRNGTDIDRDKLENCLKNLGFTTSVFDDPTHGKIQEVLTALAKEDHSNRDCLLIAVFSHGEPNKIHCLDSYYKPDSLWDPFTADRCPTLAGKPKIFLIQACQGDKLDGGVTLVAGRRTQSDASPSTDNNMYRVPNRADFLMAFSTVPGYFSWRNTSQGSWFIQSVTKIFNTFQHRLDLLTMMTYVARSVALDFESFVPTSEKMDRQKQVPFITSTLIREVYFKPKSGK